MEKSVFLFFMVASFGSLYAAHKIMDIQRDTIAVQRGTLAVQDLIIANLERTVELLEHQAAQLGPPGGEEA